MRLRAVRHDSGEVYGYSFWCPGCKRPHVYQVPRWDFNGDLDRPTFSPSLLVFTPEWTDPETGEKHARETQCHLFLTDGQLSFCGNSPHELAGKTVPLPEWPSEGARP